LKRDLTRLNGAEVLLCVEVSDSTLRYDLGLKVETYAAHGVREVWVINANTLVTRVHRRPGARGYTETADVPHTRGITPVLMPKLTLRIADLGLKPLKSKA
jgi:Uma2 family endonuclease